MTEKETRCCSSTRDHFRIQTGPPATLDGRAYSVPKPLINVLLCRYRTPKDGSVRSGGLTLQTTSRRFPAAVRSKSFSSWNST